MKTRDHLRQPRRHLRRLACPGSDQPTGQRGRPRCPILFQVGDNDLVAPPTAARRTAKKAGDLAQLREYPVDHFDVYEGYWQQRVLADQLSFLSTALTPSGTRILASS